MSTSEKAKGYKTMAIRLDDDVHAQLSVIAKLQETSIAANRPSHRSPLACQAIRQGARQPCHGSPRIHRG